MAIRAIIVASMIAICVCGAAGIAPAQDYPNRTIRLIVPFPPGGGTDIAARLTADLLSQRLGQTIAVENRGGAGSTIGLDLVAKSKPDGYTIGFSTSDGISMLPALKAAIPYRSLEDFEFITSIARTSGTSIGLHAKLPIKSVAELVDYAKANPGKLRYSTQGVGTGGHLAGALLGQVAGIELVHVPYQGTGPATLAAAGGFVDFTLSGVFSLKSHVDSGAIRALATFEPWRHPLLPDMPTLAEAGLPGIRCGNFFGLVAPLGTPQPILARIEREMQAILGDEKNLARYREIGTQPAFLSGAEYKTLMTEDLAQWRDVAQKANIVLAN